MRELTDAENEIIATGHCPYCGTTKFFEGPQGGLAVNIYCGNDEVCGARFNVLPGFMRLMPGELIQEPKGGVPAVLWGQDKPIEGLQADGLRRKRASS